MRLSIYLICFFFADFQSKKVTQHPSNESLLNTRRGFMSTTRNVDIRIVNDMLRKSPFSLIRTALYIMNKVYYEMIARSDL